MKMKEFEIIFKFSDVNMTLKAETKEEALKIADDMIQAGEIKEDTYCYETEVEE